MELHHFLMRIFPLLLSPLRIPLIDTPWTAQEFHKFRSFIGKRIIDQRKFDSSLTKLEFEEKWDNLRGFYLKEEPFFIPTKYMVPWPKVLWNFSQIAK